MAWQPDCDSVVVVVAAVVVVVLVGGGQAPWRGTHSRISMSLSAFFGFSLPIAVAVTLHLPGLFPCFLVLTVAVNAPQARLVPSGGGALPVRHLPLTLTFFREAGVHVPVGSGSLTQTWNSNVQLRFGVLTPSASQVGSQSVHGSEPPLAFAAGTPVKPIKHSVLAFITASARAPMPTSGAIMPRLSTTAIGWRGLTWNESRRQNVGGRTSLLSFRADRGRCAAARGGRARASHPHLGHGHEPDVEERRLRREGLPGGHRPSLSCHGSRIDSMGVRLRSLGLDHDRPGRGRGREARAARAKAASVARLQRRELARRPGRRRLGNLIEGAEQAVGRFTRPRRPTAVGIRRAGCVGIVTMFPIEDGV